MYIFRALLALAALALAYIGFGEARLKMHCPTPLDLDASSLTAMVDDRPSTEKPAAPLRRLRDNQLVVRLAVCMSAPSWMWPAK